MNYWNYFSDFPSPLFMKSDWRQNWNFLFLCWKHTISGVFAIMSCRRIPPHVLPNKRMLCFVAWKIPLRVVVYSALSQIKMTSYASCCRVEMHQSNQNLNTTPGKPLAFDYFLCPDSGEFDGKALSVCGIWPGSVRFQMIFFFGRGSR